MSSGNSINIGNVQQTASGAGSINQVGNNIGTTNVHRGDAEPTVPEVFDSIRSSLPNIEATADESVAEDVEEMVVRPLQTMAELPAEELSKPETMQRAQGLINQLIPFAPQIAKGLAVFGGAALSALASRNPVIAGVMALCKMGASE